MAYTGQEIFNIAMDLINKRSASGTIDTSKTAIYSVRSPSILTIWQNNISRLGDLYNTYEFSNKPIDNLLGDQFDIIEYKGTDLIRETNHVIKAYYFEVDGEGTAYIEDYNGAWNTIVTITIPDTISSFTAYKGVVTPTMGATKSRIRFTGSYYYRTVNRALFAEPFAPTKIPDYRRWTKHTMPIDFKSVDQVIEEESNNNMTKGYTKDSGYKWEGRKDMYLSYLFNGNIRIVYKPVPTKITSLTNTLQVDDITAMSGAYFLATHLLLVEDPDSASFFNGMYEDMKREADIKQPASETENEDVYGTSYINWG